MLGVPAGDRAPFRRYSLAILGALEPVASRERQAAGNAAAAEFSAYLDELIAERVQTAGRRWRHPGHADPRQGRWREAEPRRAGAELHLPAERRPRDDDQSDRQHGRCLVALSRPARAAEGRSRPDQELRRGRPALRELNQLGNRRLRRRWRSAARLCPPAPTSISASARPTATPRSSRTRPLRHSARTQPARRLRRGRAYVPGRRAGAARRHDRDRPAGGAVRRHRARRRLLSVAAAPGSAASRAIRSPGRLEMQDMVDRLLEQAIAAAAGARTRSARSARCW